ncbi:ankyrin repeat-containing domain protein [Glomus cerebriforme]|uniref:Ankyrin repeat-containing domain protein n=1 Tax=Glomus cerebriforme TaxID=658196 RepID=A0A397ST29_9GLOM|nr:ankyrin repeat-containing domain protein [Glomus cerebriforme]
MTDSSLEEQFILAYTFLNNHPEINLSNEIKLQLYGYYKVVTIGKVNTAKPPLWDFRGRAKWDAWKEVENTPAEIAMQMYIETVEKTNIDWKRDQSDDDSSINTEDDDKEENKTNAKEGRTTYVSTMSYGEEEDSEVDDIFSYTKKGDITEISKILDSGNIDINAKDDQGLTLLHWASDRGHLTVIELLIDRGADVNILSEEKETPLHFSCISEHLDCARYLYHHGANSSIKDDEDLTAFDHCSVQFKEEVIKE